MLEKLAEKVRRSYRGIACKIRELTTSLQGLQRHGANDRLLRPYIIMTFDRDLRSIRVFNSSAQRLQNISAGSKACRTIRTIHYTILS
jgi:hypothetical protein